MDKIKPSTQQSGAGLQPGRRWQVLLPVAVFLAGVVVAAMGAWTLNSRERAEATAEFDRIVERDAEEISRRFFKPVYGLNGAKGAYATHPEVRRDSFSRYMSTRDMAVEFPGVRGFGFIQHVQRSDLPAFLAAERADGAPDFNIRTLSPVREPALADLFVIKIIKPAATNAGAAGLDVGSEPVRRQGAMRALATGQPTLSGLVTLVQDNQRRAGVLLYVPLPAYREAEPSTDLGAGFRGLLYAPIVVDELLAGMSDVAYKRVRLELFDTASGTATGATLFDSVSEQVAVAEGAQPRRARHEALRVVNVPGRQLTLRARSLPAFEAGYSSAPAWLFLLGGLLSSGLLAGLIHQQMTGRRRAESLAQEMTAELSMLALVARRTNNGVVITDARRRITWVNEGFERLSGYSAAEVMGLVPGSFLQCAETDQATVQTIRSALNDGRPVHCELVNRSKQGRVYWLEIDIKPLRDALGGLTGFMAATWDISERKEAEFGLARERLSLQNIIDGTQAGTWEWNVETGQTVFNERWAQIIGYTLAELGDCSIQTWLDASHPEDHRLSAMALERHFDSLTPGYECEVRLRHRSGHWVWALDRGRLFSRSEDGRPRWMAGTRMDITERKQAEAALRASQSLLSQTGLIGGVGGWELDVATQVLSWTDQTCLIHDLPPGHQPSIEEALGYYTEASRPLMTMAVEEGLANGQRWDLELPLVTASGRSIWVRALGQAEFVDGQPVRLVGAFQDITARRELEEQLRAKNELVTSVIENLPCGLSVFDDRLQLVAVNQSFRQLLDLPDELFTQPGLGFEDMVRFNARRGEYGDVSAPGAEERLVQDMLARVRAPLQPHQFERQRPDGRVLEVRGAPMPGGGFVTTYTDVTGRKAAEAEVKRSAALLRGAIDTIDEAFVLYDPQDRLVLCNDKYREIYASAAHMMTPGARFEDIIRAWAEAGSCADAVDHVDEWVAERVRAHRAGRTDLVQKLASGKSLRVIESQMPDGHVVGFRIDVTELARATEAAEKASQAKSQFLANMSHEIRTPMNAILGMLKLLRRTELDARQADYASKTEGAARSLLGLLNDILDFSKVEAGKMTLDPQPFRVDQLIRDLGVVLSANVGAKPVEVLFDIDHALPRWLVGDALRLQQVLINLSGNAVKFTAEGEVVVSVRVQQQQDGVVTLRIGVRDTGIGIAPENQQRIFSGFTQAEASTTRRFGGTGLGVAISQRLVGLMGSELKLDSALGQGSTFHFDISLPVADQAQLGEPAAPPAQPLPAGLCALVVDDNATAREVLRHMSEGLGWQVDLAASGEEALATLTASAAAGKRYDVVLLDWQMPGLDGFETAERLRAADLGQGVPVVVMVTAQGREMLAQRTPAQQATLDDFLVKPVTASMLLDAVVDARQRRELPHLSTKRSAVEATGLLRLSGLRLLLTEDNLNNQQVALELLADEGALMQVANNGLEAVQMVQAAQGTHLPFDLVLMDLQMPVMDGFTATARIRQDLGLADLPIVAMTANAMASDREACLAAGMNDHVGKPFDLDHLVAVVRRLTGHTQSSAQHPPCSAQQCVEPKAAATKLPPRLNAAAQAAAHAAGVDLAPALQRMGGKQAVYARMLRTAVRDFRELAQGLQTVGAAGQGSDALEAGTAAETARNLHTLKGLAATLGITALAQAAKQAESAVVSGESGGSGVQAAHARSACAEMGIQLHALLPALEALAACLLVEDGGQGPAPGSASAFISGAAPVLGTGEPEVQASTATADPVQFHRSLGELAGLLDQFDMRATEYTPALVQQAGPRFEARMNELDEAVASLDFERAVPLCRQLILETQP